VIYIIQIITFAVDSNSTKEEDKGKICYEEERRSKSREIGKIL
jgi:hypothetical protein